MRSSQSRLIWILLAAAVALLVIAIVAGAVYALLRHQPPIIDGWQDPISAIVPDEVVAGLALYPLAGASELETIDVSLSDGDLETAYAVLVSSMELSDGQRIGRLTLLGGKFAEAGKVDRAGLCFQQIADVALVAPRMSDPARADALLGAGAGWANIDHSAQALQAYDQVHLLATESPYLQMAQRRDLLSVLRGAYSDLGELEKAAACQQEIVNLDQQSSPQPPAIAIPLPDLPQGTDPVSSPDVGGLEEARRQAAYGVLQAVSDGSAAPANLVAGLGQALQAEDAAKVALYQQSLDSTSQPGKRINIQWHWIRWLMLKYQIAVRGVGLSVVPEWEAQLPSIQSALTKAYEGLYFDYEDQVTALPDASLMGPGSYLVRRQVLLAGRLGQYPNYPAAQMANKMKDAVAAMIAAGSREQLYLDVAVEEGGLQFYLSPADRYGQPAQSP